MHGERKGALSHYYGRAAGLELREDVTVVREPNMVASMEPTIMISKGESPDSVSQLQRFGSGFRRIRCRSER